MSDVPDAQTRGRAPAPAPGRAAAGVAIAAALVLLAVVWGEAATRSGWRLHLDAPPFFGRWLRQPARTLLPTGLFAVLLALAWPPSARRLPWPAVLAGSGLLSFAWALALAVSDGGRERLWRPFTSRYEYLPLAHRVRSPRAFLSTFVERLPTYPTHVKGHPPGPVLAFWGLIRLGLRDEVIAVVVLALAASAAPAALVAFDQLAGRAAARRAAVFAGLAPAALWATSPDGAFMAAAAWATALVCVAACAPRPAGGRRALAAAAGLLCGTVAACSYGAPLLLAPVAAVLAWCAVQRRWGPVVGAALGACVVPLALALAGFDWIGGFAATRHAYWAGAASDRPYPYFLVANLAVVAVSVGPAGAAGLASLPGLRSRTGLLVGAALTGVLLADLTGYAKGEVERIWLPLTPFLVLGTAAVRVGPVSARCWLGAQLVVAIGLEWVLRSPW